MSNVLLTKRPIGFGSSGEQAVSSDIRHVTSSGQVLITIRTLQSLHLRLQRIEHALSLPIHHEEASNSSLPITGDSFLQPLLSYTTPHTQDSSDVTAENDTRMDIEGVEMTVRSSSTWKLEGLFC
jgi:hypothetical protein